MDTLGDARGHERDPGRGARREHERMAVGIAESLGDQALISGGEHGRCRDLRTDLAGDDRPLLAVGADVDESRVGGSAHVELRRELPGSVLHIGTLGDVRRPGARDVGRVDAQLVGAGSQRRGSPTDALHERRGIDHDVDDEADLAQQERMAVEDRKLLVELPLRPRHLVARVEHAGDIGLGVEGLDELAHLHDRGLQSAARRGVGDAGVLLPGERLVLGAGDLLVGR